MIRLPTGLRLARHRGRVRAAPGVELGLGVRFDVAPGASVALGAGCVLGERTRVLARGTGRITIGAGAVLGERCTLVAREAITLGERVRLGDAAVVVDFDHVFDDVERPIRLQPVTAAPVAIGDDARIGIAAGVLRGVRIGAGAVVGPHAVVTADVEAGAHVGGVPARPVALSGR